MTTSALLPSLVRIAPAASRSLWAPCLALLLAAAVPAQVSTAKVDLGVAGDYGCQNQASPPTLSNGTEASAEFAFRYDAGKAELQLQVTNTSKVITGVPNPLITRVFFNLPKDAVTGVELTDQGAAAGAVPAFVLAGPGKVACFGDFDVHLDGGQARSTIANAAADTIVGPQNSWSVGPVLFTMKLTGPGVATLTAGAIANGFSQNAPYQKVAVAAKFQSAGQDGDGSGFLGNRPECAGGVWILGEPRIGSSIDICSSVADGCHGCIIVSVTPGPQRVGNLVVPIGLPVVELINLQPFNVENTLCVKAPIPDDKNLVGVKFYMATVSVSPQDVVTFSQPIVVQVLDKQ